jgi:hypothetical protein
MLVLHIATALYWLGVLVFVCCSISLAFVVSLLVRTWLPMLGCAVLIGVLFPWDSLPWNA